MTEAQTREERPRQAARLVTETTDTPNTTRLQLAGQLRRAQLLNEQAARLQAAGRYPEARRLRHQANALRQAARGTRPQAPLVDIERQLAAGQLARWARRAA